MAKPILIISHERSGTHRLINTIAFNFDRYLQWHRPNQNWIDIPLALQSSQQIQDHLNTYRCHRSIHKTHIPFEIIEPIWQWIQDNFLIFYPIRDGRDVLVSFWRHTQMDPNTPFPQIEKFSDFIQMNPEPYEYIPHCYPRTNMVMRWKMHRDGYIGKCQWVPFEEPIDAILIQISHILKIPPHRHPIYYPTLSDPMIGNPSGGKIGGWRQIFSHHDLLFFEQHTMGVKI